MKNPVSQLNFLFFSTLMAILIWMASPSVKANIPLQSIFPFQAYEARYALSLRGVPAGEAIHKLVQRENGHYYFETRTEPALRLLPFHYLESTDFAWQENKIKPQNYYYKVHEGKRRKEGHVIFDWQKKSLSNPALKTPWEHDLPPDVQDKLTQGFSLRYALKKGQTQFHYTVAEIDKMRDYTFTILSHERLSTKLGVLETVKLQHISHRGYQTVTWLAKDYDYLPVKMLQVRHGKTVAGGEITAFRLLAK